MKKGWKHIFCLNTQLAWNTFFQCLTSCLLIHTFHDLKALFRKIIFIFAVFAVNLQISTMNQFPYCAKSKFFLRFIVRKKECGVGNKKKFFNIDARINSMLTSRKKILELNNKHLTNWKKGKWSSYSYKLKNLNK